MLIYCIATALANMIAIAVFHKSIQINALSVLPIVFIALMLFQSALLKKVKSENVLFSTDVAYIFS